MVRSAAMEDVASKLDRIASLLEVLVTKTTDTKAAEVAAPPPSPAEEVVKEEPAENMAQIAPEDGYTPEGLIDDVPGPVPKPSSAFVPRVIKRGSRGHSSNSTAHSSSAHFRGSAAQSSGSAAHSRGSAAHSSGSAAHSSGSAAHSSGSAAVPSTRISTATHPRPSLQGRFMKVVRPRKPLETFHQFSESYSAAPSVDEVDEDEPVVDDDTFVVKKVE